MIDKNNYEAYLIDYLDGTLAPQEEAALWLFLEAHPEIKEELDGLADLHLRPESSGFDPAPLMKNPRDDRDMLLARLLEGDLDEVTQNDVEEKIASNPEWQHAWMLMQATRLAPVDTSGFDHSKLIWPDSLTPSEEELLAAIDRAPQNSDSDHVIALRKTRLSPDMSIVFPGKSALKKTPVLVMRLRWMSVAAAIAFILLAFPFLNSTDSSTASRIPAGNPEAATADAIRYPQKVKETPFDQSEPAQALPFFASQETDSVDDRSQDEVNRPVSATGITRLASLKPALVSNKLRAPEPAGFVSDLPTMAQLPDQEPNAESFLTGREFFTHQVKKNLWGRENYPEEGYVLALAEKGANKISDRLNIEVDPSTNGKEKRGFRLRVGSIEIAR